MTTVALTASPTQLDSGTTYDLTVVNSGSSTVHVLVDSGNLFDQRLSPGQSVVVYPHGLPVTAYARSGSGQVDVTTATDPQAAQRGTYAPLDARDTSITSFTVGMLVSSGSSIYRVTTAHAAPFDSTKATQQGGTSVASGVTVTPTGNIAATNVQTALAELDTEKADVSSTSTITANTQTGTTYTLVLTDAGKLVRATNASAVTLTVPPNSSVAFPTGTVLNVYAGGAGGVTIAAGAGVTIRNNTSALTQYSEVSLRKDGTDEWVRLG